MDDYDAYLVHASDDEQVSNAIADALHTKGFQIWFNEFQPGFSVKRQMESGLQSATCAIIIVTIKLFTKRWALEELDAIFALEDARQSRIIPVWVDLTSSDIQKLSPMLPSRSAIRFRNIEQTASELGEALVLRLRARSPAQLLRSTIASGIQWRTGPVWLRQSFSYFDDHYANFEMAKLTRYPNVPNSGDQRIPSSLENALNSPHAFDGTSLMVIGRQRGIGRQMLSMPSLLPRQSPSQSEGIASYVFQLRSYQLPSRLFAYVYCHLPWASPPALDPSGPWGDEEDLCWVSGVILAYGAVPMSGGEFGQCIYMAASEIVFTPQVSEQ